MNYTDIPASVECRYVHHLNSSLACDFIRSTHDCQVDSGVVNFLDLVYCDLPRRMFIPSIITMLGYLSVLFVFVATTADEYFCPVLAYIAKKLHMSQNLTGVTLVAFGNGAADVFCATMAVLHMRSQDAGLAFGALLGGAMFITTVVVGSVSISAPFKSIERPLLRDLIMLLGAVFWLLCIISDKQIRLGEAIGFMVLYVIYVLIVIFGRLIRKRYKRHKSVQESIQVVESGSTSDLEGSNTYSDSENSHVVPDNISPDESYHSVNDERDESVQMRLLAETPPDDFLLCVKKVFVQFTREQFKSYGYFRRFYVVIKYPVSLILKLTCPRVDSDDRNYSWNRVLNTFHCLSSPLFILSVTNVIARKVASSVPVYCISIPVSQLIAFCVWMTTIYNEPPPYMPLFASLAFITAFFWIYFIASEIVGVLHALGIMMNVSNVIMGLSILACGNSVADLTTDVVLARHGMPNSAVSACFGGPVFNILIGVGFPFTVYTAVHGTLQIQTSLLQTILPYFMLGTVCFHLIVLPVSRFKFTRPYGILLLIIYIVYMSVCIYLEVA